MTREEKLKHADEIFARVYGSQSYDILDDAVLEPLIAAAKADAWDEGYTAGHPEDPCSLHPHTNPYRDE